MDKISKLKKKMGMVNLNVSNAIENKLPIESDKETLKLENEVKKKRYFFS